MNKIEEAITEHWGPKCPDFEKDCFCCQVWAEYEQLTKDDSHVVD